MIQPKPPRPICLTLLACLLIAWPAAADPDPDRDSSNRIVVINDDGDHATVTLDGCLLNLVTTDDDGTTVHEFDFSHLGEIIDEALEGAMVGLDGALAEIEAEQISIHMDDGDMVYLEAGDRTCAVNLQVIAAELQGMLAGLGDEISLEIRADDDHDEMAELEAELDRLREELESLQEELDEVY